MSIHHVQLQTVLEEQHHQLIWELRVVHYARCQRFTANPISGIQRAYQAGKKVFSNVLEVLNSTGVKEHTQVVKFSVFKFVFF